LAAVQDTVQQVLDMSGFSDIFQIFSTVEAAVTNLSLLKKAPAAVPGCGNRPEDGPQSRLFSAESNFEGATHS